MSEMEVSNLRNPGDLVFSSDNEIMSVAVKGNAIIEPGNLVTFDGNNFAQKGTASNIDAIAGFGVCIYEGVDNTGGGDGDKLVQIVTGNGYVTMLAGGTVKPFSKIIPDGNSKAVAATLSDSANVAAVVTFIKKVIGRSYGNPGQMVKPTNVANNKPIIVRLGSD